MPRSKNFLVVAAFDFGTTYSGYAYSYTNDKTQVCTNQNWYTGGASSKLASLKTPTSVLLDDKGQFHSFGFEAEDHFAMLAEDKLHTGWRLFRRFKMTLHTTKALSRNSTVEDIEGKSYPAMDIFALAIKYLHRHLLDNFKQRVPDMKETDIQYIITVPAIWDIGAKQFMREAAGKAGIDGERLEMAYESEVAAIWCSGLNYGGTCTEMEKPSLGSKYIVIDLGGGTADVSIIQKLPDNHVKMIHKASGGAWGGIYVDQKFLEYLENVLGKGVLQELRTLHIQDYFELIREFETKKRSSTFHTSKFCMIRLPYSLMEIAQTRNAASGNSIRLSDKLRINQSDVENWFLEPVSRLVDHINVLRKLDHVNDVDTVLLVGGFAESTYVQERLRKALSEITLIVPEDAGLAVLKGAVLFGHNPCIVASRVMSHTYGTSMIDNYKEKIHPPEMKVFLEGKWKVKNCFKIYVKVNEEISVDHEVVRSFNPLSIHAMLRVYRTMTHKPLYTTEPGCELLGTLQIINSDSVALEDQDIKVHFMFGLTELLIKVKQAHTGEEHTLSLDCLK